MSFSYIDNPGIMKNTGYNRYMGRVNLYSDITDWLRVGTRTSGNVTDQEVSVTSYNGSSHINSMNTEKMVPCIYPYYDGKYGAPEGPEEDPQSHNGLWDNVLNGFDKYSQLYTEWYAQVKFLKYFTYNFDIIRSFAGSEKYRTLPLESSVFLRELIQQGPMTHQLFILVCIIQGRIVRS